MSNYVKKGTVLKVRCLKGVYFDHYGIYAGNGKVIHFTKGVVKKTSLKKFVKGSDGKTVDVVGFSCKLLPSKESYRRAKSKIGDAGYNLIFNNCEHFVTWCRLGKKKSSQVLLNFTGISTTRTVKISKIY